MSSLRKKRKSKKRQSKHSFLIVFTLSLAFIILVITYTIKTSSFSIEENWIQSSNREKKAIIHNKHGKIFYPDEFTSNGVSNSQKKSDKEIYLVIILDDAGNGRDIEKRFIQLPLKITIAVLPFQRRSKEISYLAHINGKEVILHIPMEPLKRTVKDGKSIKDEIKIGLSFSEIKKRMEEMFSEVPHMKGANNHQGSKATAEKDTMDSVMKILKTHNFYFIDSRTSALSVAYKVAREVGVPALKRDIFLDNINSYEYVKSQFKKLIQIARKRGYAIGIGHITRSATYEVLRNCNNLLQGEIKLIFPSELIRKLYYREVTKDVRENIKIYDGVSDYFLHNIDRERSKEFYY